MTRYLALLADFEAVAWFGFVAPAGTPPEVVARLNAEIGKALAIPEVRQRLLDAGSEIVGMTPEAADRHLQGDLARWGAVVKAANVKAN
jgi:tripartite-type tricarboxylate transporter receptor subunit TctC